MVIMVMVLVYSDRASQGNSPDIDSLNRLIESEFHTREPGGVKTPVCDRCVPCQGGQRVSGQHMHIMETQAHGHEEASE